MSKINPYKAGGYVVVDRVSGTRSLIFEHRIVAEQMIGRPLRPEEVVHHIDRNRSNNDPSNLIVFNNQRSHILEHSNTKMKRLIVYPDGVREWVRVPHVCEICGKEFFRNNDNARFCSAKCDGLSKHNKIQCKCPFCGKTFERVPASDQEFCSPECYSKHKYHWIKDTCALCGSVFERPRSSHRRHCCIEHAPDHIPGIPSKLTIQTLLATYPLKKAAEVLGVSETKMSHYRMMYAIPSKYHRLVTEETLCQTKEESINS